MKGVIARKLDDKGFGFITSEGRDYFFHHSCCNTDFKSLEVGDEVTFESEMSSKGLRAVEVEREY